MEPKIVEQSEFTVVGMSLLVSGEEKSAEISRLWQKFTPKLVDLETRDICYGLCRPHPEGMDYLAGVEVDPSFEAEESGLEKREVPSQTYAVFTHSGPVSRIGHTFDYIYGTWLPQSSYTPGEGPDFERYDERFLAENPQSEDSVMEVWVAVCPQK